MESLAKKLFRRFSRVNAVSVDRSCFFSTFSVRIPPSAKSGCDVFISRMISELMQQLPGRPAAVTRHMRLRDILQ